METTAERVARNESAFRDANERIEKAADGMAHLDEIPMICECPVQTCTQIVRLTRSDYEHVRSDGAWFWVAEGHEVATVEGVEIAKVRERRESFTIMEKIGEAGEVSQQLDPRKPVGSER
jgi:hypothetical protein